MNYKLSRYVVFSEPIINANYRLAYSTSCASLILLKSDLHRRIVNNLLEEINAEVLEHLLANKIVVPQELDELHEVIKENKEAIHSATTLTQVIQPSANCQLGCNYCGQVHSKESLPSEFNEKILERVSQHLQAQSYKKLLVVWFGGEPLMGLGNVESLSDDLVSIASRFGCEYTARMVTNGLSLKRDVFFHLVDDCKITDYEVTLDGTHQSHDARRYTKSKEKTFDLIFKNLTDILHDERFVSKGCTMKIRCNVDRSNSDSAFDLIDKLDEAGILNKITFYTAPIHSWGNDAHLEALSIEEYAQFQINVFFKLMEKGHQFPILPGARKNIVCLSLSAHGEVYDAFGDVYNCTEVSQVPAYKGMDHYKMKKMYDDNFFNDERKFSSWNDDILNNEVPCTKCRILPVCGGACPKLWKENLSPCPAIKYNIEDAMLLEFSRNQEKYLTPFLHVEQSGNSVSV